MGASGISGVLPIAESRYELRKHPGNSGSAILVLNGAYGALGFLIASKGMTRFKQLDDREFAEYFLIGTLLSIIFVGAAALLTQRLLVAW